VADISRSIQDGAIAGLLASATLAIGQTIATTTDQASVVTFRRFASVLLGPDALATTPAAAVVVIGLAGHLCLSAMYGVCYGAYCSTLSLAARSSLRRQAALGSLYGALLWFINIELLARYRYPWLVDRLGLGLGLGQLVLHAVCFGLCLGIRYATAQRHDCVAAYAAPLPVALARRRGARSRFAVP
jgi:hypothetical protein